jgi:PAS domain S-box-containing protein
MLVIPLRGAKLRVGTLWIGYAQGVLPQAEREMAVLYAKMAGAVVESMYLAEAVRSAHDRMVSILSSTREGMLLVGEDRRIAMANRAFSQLLGIEGARLEGLTIDVFCGGDELAHLSQEVRQPLCDALTTTMGGSTDIFEGEIQVADGTERELTWQILPVRAARSSGNAALLVLRDVTMDRQMERLRQDVASMLVHDLRSPLTNMMVSVDLLLKRTTGPLTDAQARILTIASSSCQQMLDLVNGLLDIRRLEQRTRELERHPVDITSIIKTVLERLERMAQDRRVHLCMDAAPVPQLEGDPDMLRRVLQNLVDNAIKFSPPEETVTVRSYIRNAEELGQGYGSGTWVVVEVEDHGSGIAEEYHKVIFELFGQTPEGHGRGTGLGLAFCKLAIEAHGGKIWLRSSPGEGSQFFFSLPVSP